MNIEFKKIELASRIFLKWEYTETDNGRKTKIKASADAVIHDDLSDAIQGLAPHFVLLTEMRRRQDVTKIIDLKELPEDFVNKFKVTSVTIEDNKGEMNYRIAGYKILNTGKTVSFETPKIKHEASEEDQYPFFNKMVEQIELIKDETLEYMDGKEGTSVQSTMEFDSDFDPEADTDGEEVEQEEFDEAAA